MHVHHPPQNKGDSYHVVALTSTTLGSIKLDSSKIQNNQAAVVDGGDTLADVLKKGHYNGDADEKGNNLSDKGKEFSLGLVEAKAWSTMIEEKIPKIAPRTPIMTPPGEPETINTWELMEGLEDVSPLRSPNHFRSFSFDISRDQSPDPVVCVDRPKSKLSENGAVSPRQPMWLQMADGEDSDSNANPMLSLPEFDPEVISTFRKSFQELSPTHPFHIRPLENENESFLETKKLNFNGILPEKKCGKEKLVVYFTSLRGVRKTFEDCCHVRVILKSLGVRVDERDVSMHSGFKDELKELLGEGCYKGGLPRVFVGKKYIGGAEEIRRMNEEGELEKVVEGCETVDDGGGGGSGGGCEACGDIRFVPCETCNGSCKVYYECEEEEDEEEEKEKELEREGEFGFQRCPDCNENGLIRCPICCY